MRNGRQNPWLVAAVAENRFHFEVFLDPEDALFASVTGSFVTAERSTAFGRRVVEVDFAIVMLA
jgi:hypothetical protein